MKNFSLILLLCFCLYCNIAKADCDDSLLVGAGTMTLGTGIWSVIVDKKQKQHLSTVSVLPIMSYDKRFGTRGGLLLFKEF